MMHYFFGLLFMLLMPLQGVSQDRFQLQTTTGELISVTDLLENGNAKVFVFWSNYCKICKLEMKGIRNIGKNWWEDYEAEIIFVSLENYPSDTYLKQDFLQDLIAEQGVKTLHDVNMQFYNSVSDGSIPTTILYNSEGELIQKWVAYDDGLERSIGMYFKKLHVAKKESAQR